MDNVIYEFYCMSGETTGKLETNYSWDFYSLEQKHRDKYAKPVFFQENQVIIELINILSTIIIVIIIVGCRFLTFDTTR